MRKFLFPKNFGNTLEVAEIVGKCRGKNLFFSNLVEENIRKAEMVFISVNTPTKESGIGAGMAVDLRFIEECTRQIAKFAKNADQAKEIETAIFGGLSTIRSRWSKLFSDVGL